MGGNGPGMSRVRSAPSGRPRSQANVRWRTLRLTAEDRAPHACVAGLGCVSSAKCPPGVRPDVCEVAAK
jgi:hypothetical protein